MCLDICKYQRNKKEYKRVLLREGYRENGKVKKRTIANLSGCSDAQISAVKFAFDNVDAINNNLISDLSDAESGKVYSKQFGFRFQMQVKLHIPLIFALQ